MMKTQSRYDKGAQEQSMRTVKYPLVSKQETPTTKTKFVNSLNSSRVKYGRPIQPPQDHGIFAAASAGAKDS